MDAVAAQVSEPSRLRIVGTWLVEEVDRHTCGTGPGGHYGAHEPGCGQEPIVDLSTLPGFAELLARPALDPAAPTEPIPQWPRHVATNAEGEVIYVDDDEVDRCFGCGGALDEGVHGLGACV